MHFPEHVLAKIRKFFGPERIQPDWMDLTDLFTLLSDLAPDCVYIIDGLDAVNQECSKSLLGLFHSLFSRSESSNRLRLLLFSRDQVPGYINIATFIPGIRHISTSANVRRDIELYIDTSIADKSLYRRLTENAGLLGQVKETLLAESSDMYVPYLGLLKMPIRDLPALGFCGCTSNWKFFGIRVIQMQKYVQPWHNYRRGLRKYTVVVSTG
jgi:hypothetical protein